MEKENKKKTDFVDDDRTVANMDFDTIGNYRRTNKANIDYRAKRQELSDLNLTSKETWAIIKALYAKVIPFVIILFLSFIVVFFIISLIWRIF